LREPEFIGGEVDLRINIYRGQIAPNDLNDLNNGNKVLDITDEMPDTTKKVPDSADKMPDNEQEQQIYKYVLKNGFITTAKAVELLGVKHRRARAVLLDMVEGAYLKKEGAAQSPAENIL
jgi:predicted HTH transcriptional regulator